MVAKANVDVVENLAGGVGVSEVHTIVSDEELGKAANLYAKVVLKPHASVGWHQHVGETEPYYILSGKGVFIDNDESRTEVGAGDVCTIKDKQYHSIENISEDEDLEFIALIYNLFS